MARPAGVHANRTRQSGSDSEGTEPMDQDLSLAQMLVAKRALPPNKLQETLDACRHAGVPLGRFAAESGCVERAPLLESLREMNGGVGDGRGYAAVEDALLASEVIADGLTSHDIVERLRADVFTTGGRLGDALASAGHVAPDRVSACVQRVKDRSGICPTCFSTFENDWLRSVSAAACPICVEPWETPGQAPPFRGNGNGNGHAAFDEAATVIGSVEGNPFDEEATVIQSTDPSQSSGAVPSSAT